MLTPEAAIQRCIAAYNRACELDDARNDHSPESLKRVNSAWRRSMPYLTNDLDAIDAFIACVTHGLVLEIFPLAEASKLLYAAQVAIGSRRARQQAARDHAKMHPTPSPSPLKEPLTPAQPLAAASPETHTPPPSPLEPAPAPSPATVSSSPRLGDHNPTPTPSPAAASSMPAMPPPSAAQSNPIRQRTYSPEKE